MTDQQIMDFMNNRWKVGDFMERGEEPCSLRDLRALVEVAVAAERERCAKLCDESADMWWRAWDQSADPTDQGRALEAEALAAAFRA